MFEWSCVSEGMAKEAIDATLCALCFAQPHFFDSLLEWFQVLLRPPPVSVLTDDSKVSAPSTPPFLPTTPRTCISLLQDRRHQLGSITDDSKADSEASEGGQPITDEQAAASRPRSPKLNSINNINLDSSRLTTLAVTSQSPAALTRLVESGFVQLVCGAVHDFCAKQLACYVKSIVGAEGLTDASKSATNSPRAHLNSDPLLPPDHLSSSG